MIRRKDIKRIISSILTVIMMLLPLASLGATGHINGCTNTDFSMNCCTKTFVIIAKSGYEVMDVLVNGVSKGAITSYTFTDITGPQSLKVITRSLGGSGTGGDSGGSGTLPEGQYRVKFNANTGTGSMPSQIFEEGTTQNLNVCTYAKEYYHFIGWALTADGEVVVADGAVYSVTEETTLYAKWEPDVYTITYNLNGGSVSGNPTTYTVESATITLNNPTKYGYMFLGWTGSNGETASTSITIPQGSAGNRTYTANWQDNYWTMTLDLSTNRCGIVSVNGVTYDNVSTTFIVQKGDSIRFYDDGYDDYSVFVNNSNTYSNTYTPTSNCKIKSNWGWDDAGDYLYYYITTNQ